MGAHIEAKRETIREMMVTVLLHLQLLLLYCEKWQTNLGYFEMARNHICY